MATCHEAGKLYDFELPGYEDDVKKIAKNLQKRMRWIWEEDLEQEVADAKLFFQTAAKQIDRKSVV